MPKREFMTRCVEKRPPKIYEWQAKPSDILFSQVTDYIICPVSRYFVNADPAMDYFCMRSKKAYNKLELRNLIIHKINYFEKFYDTDKELLSIYARIKMLIDCVEEYSKEDLFRDIKNYILNGASLRLKLDYMNQDNYTKFNIKFNGKDRVLYYDNTHIFIMLRISLSMAMIIPLLSHYASKHRIQNIDPFLLDIFSYIIKSYSDFVDLYAKLIETCYTKISQSKTNNKIWNKQDIRFINQSTLAIHAVDNIVINIMPKYIYDDNPVNINYASIGNVIKYKVTDAGYDFNYTSLSSSQRDVDENSEMDKFESYLTKVDEALYIQNKVNGDSTMNRIISYYGPFDPDEIEFYKKRLKGDDTSVIHPFQKELVYNLFYKYFGDTSAIKNIEEDDYIIMILIAKKITLQAQMIMMPYIFSSKITKYTKKKRLNKKERDKMIASPLFKMIQNKYRNKKVEDKVEEIIATILSSKFEMIEYHKDSEGNSVDGVQLPVEITDYIIEETLNYILWIS